MAFRYNIFQEAAEDLDNALAWYTSEGGTELSTRFFKSFINARKKACENPLHFPRIYDEFRMIKIHHFPYKIIYKLKEEALYIVAVAHEKQHPNYWKERVE